MLLDEFLFVVLIWVIPLLLLFRAWHRYSKLASAKSTGRSPARGALGLLTLSSGFWLVLYFLVLLGDHGKKVTAMVNHLPAISTLVLINFPVCLCSLLLSQGMSKTAQGAIPFRKAIAQASGYMMLVWLLTLTMQH